MRATNARRLGQAAKNRQRSRDGLSSDERERIKSLEPEVKVLRRANQLWVLDFSYVSTWQGWQYAVFVIDVYARRIAGWRQSSCMRTDFVRDALEQALYERQPERTDALIHHSDSGSQYISIRYSERLSEARN